MFLICSNWIPWLQEHKKPILQPNFASEDLCTRLIYSLKSDPRCTKISLRTALSITLTLKLLASCNNFRRSHKTPMYPWPHRTTQLVSMSQSFHRACSLPRNSHRLVPQLRCSWIGLVSCFCVTIQTGRILLVDPTLLLFLSRFLANNFGNQNSTSPLQHSSRSALWNSEIAMGKSKRFCIEATNQNLCLGLQAYFKPARNR